MLRMMNAINMPSINYYFARYIMIYFPFNLKIMSIRLKGKLELESAISEIVVRLQRRKLINFVLSEV